jgi:uncharacterized lipoprotein YajG
MHRTAGASLVCTLSLAETLRALCMVLAALMVVVFLAGCETTDSDQANSNSTIRKQHDTGYAHGQVDVMYGFGGR